MMHRAVRKNSGSLCVLLLLLMLASAAPLFGQQPAPARTAPATGARASETQVDASIPDDPAVDQMLAVYSPRVRALDVLLGVLRGELKKSGIGGGSLGNFVADGMRAQASLKRGRLVDFALMNGGGLRRNTITGGDLRARDIFELLPFENALITIDLTGEQLQKLLQVVVSSREAQSGARITYVINADKTSHLESANLLDAAGKQKEIDPQAIYSIVTIDYLYNVGGRYSVLRDGKNMRPLNITLRDAIMEYVRLETAAHREIKPNLDGRFVLDRAHSVMSDDKSPEPSFQERR